MKRFLLVLLVVLPLFSQTAPLILSPEVAADGRVTFRLRAPNAKEVLLSREGAARQPMQQDDKGVWSVTTDPLPPDYYGYTFLVDGVGTLDPANWLMKPNLQNPSSMVHVPGPATLPWELNIVPHGEVHRHLYHSAVASDDRDFYV